MDIFRRYKTIEEMLPGFLLAKETGTCYKTSSAYHAHTFVLINWLKDQGLSNIPMRKISSQNMTDFFYFLSRDKELDRTTCEKYFLQLRLFFNYAKSFGEVDVIPFDHIIFPKKKKDQGADVIQSVHLKPLLLAIKEKDPQLFLACMIQYYCFVRPGKELRLMKVGDIDLTSGLITVQQMNAKNGIRQVITMPQQLIDICIEYGIDVADKSLYVFGKKKKFGTKAVSVNMLRYRFNIIRNSLNLPTAYKFYSFKHTGATNLHMSGISMRELMDQLRHTQLHSTQHYLKKHCGIVNNRIRDNFPSPI